MQKEIVMAGRSCVIAFLMFTACQVAGGAITLPQVIDSNMVLQRGVQVPIWGKATAGATVTVRFRDQEQSAQADAEGAWMLRLAPLDAGGPDELVIQAGADTVALTNVLVGEVWLGSGQSNMAGATRGYAAKDPVLAKAQSAGPYPRLRLCATSRGGWREATPDAINGFSALMFAFGLRLHQELDVPVGLMVGAVGGTPSGLWLSSDMLAADEACQVLINSAAAQERFERGKQKYPEWLARWTNAVAKAKAEGRRLPRKPRPPAAPGESNRGPVGQLYERFIHPVVPFAIRGVLWDQGEAGTSLADVDQYTMMGALIRGWRSAWQEGDFPFLYVQKPSGGGCAWDPTNPVTVQADPFTPLPAKAPTVASGQYREWHIRIMSYPNTWMVTASDLGGMTHPINKSGYGARAARVAFGAVYGRKVEVYGPVYRSHAVEGSKVRVHFAHVGQGLAYRHGNELQGFALAGADGVYHWANAEIDGDTVVVSCDRVPEPVAVNYGWSRKRPWANLFNQDGLPALTFRTDTW